MLKSCVIYFDEKPNGVFYTGDVVTGQVRIILNEPEIISDLILKSRGDCKCEWTERHGAGNIRLKIIYTANEKYFKSSMSLLPTVITDETKSDTVTLTAGLHFFPFSITLPLNLPTSFESKMGYIRYIIEVKAIRPKKRSHKFEMPFTVVTKCDLNTIPDCVNPVTIEVRKSFNTFFVNKGNFTMTVAIPMTGFLPGQCIPIQLSMVNNSKIPIKEVLFIIEKKITYTAKPPSKHSTTKNKNIAVYGAKGVDKMEETFYPVGLPVPAAPPTTLIPNLPITIQYVLKVKAKVSGMHFDASVCIPILVGNVPFEDGRRYCGFGEDDAANPDSSDIARSKSADKVHDDPTDHKLSPPTYNEYVQKPDDDTDSDDINSENDAAIEIYKPRYPMFNFSNAVQSINLKDKLNPENYNSKN